MLEVIRKYEKGKKIQIGSNIAIITSDLIRFKEFYAIYSDIIDNNDNSWVCRVYNLHDKIALIIRNKKKLLEMRINY